MKVPSTQKLLRVIVLRCGEFLIQLQATFFRQRQLGTLDVFCERCWLIRLCWRTKRDKEGGTSSGSGGISAPQPLKKKKKKKKRRKERLRFHEALISRAWNFETPAAIKRLCSLSLSLVWWSQNEQNEQYLILAHWLCRSVQQLHRQPDDVKTVLASAPVGPPTESAAVLTLASVHWMWPSNVLVRSPQASIHTK